MMRTKTYSLLKSLNGNGKVFHLIAHTSFLTLFFFAFLFLTSFNSPSYKIARLKYNGGGDWYGDRTALPNLVKFCNDNIGTNFYPDEAIVEPGSAEIFNYPFIFVTGHGNIILSQQEALNLRSYLIGGGFLHICDNYGFDKFVRLEMKKVFPELEFVELPPNHPIFNQKFKFPNGLPKVHEHDGKRAQPFALIYQGRVVCFYDYESDLGNGWEDQGIYTNDSAETHQKALQMGANLVQYAMSN
ncbi:DUF4159 domain-containing protein [Solitalea sp. MAHUQ-68]|uniref:DUF4159 domain-containing protein n=1 Tax=Solitalea agri TaxID=2953739 RepID=A0A9X2EYF9_9SPHI|nr:DUF4159 domain-containing protein [Solitalea agri]MCO4291287.1 DUF4159 domain-containing protein [Solitalea agri]